MLINEKRIKDAARTAKCDAKKRSNDLVPRKHWVHESNAHEFKRVAKLLEEPGVRMVIDE